MWARFPLEEELTFGDDHFRVHAFEVEVLGASVGNTDGPGMRSGSRRGWSMGFGYALGRSGGWRVKVSLNDFDK